MTHREDSPIVYKKENSFAIEKHGVRMRIYNGAADCPQAAVVYQETDSGHAEEFLHETSYFIYYIIEGSGTWIIEDIEYEVSAGDVVIVPPGRRFFFRGALKQLCVTSPAWDESGERHVRFVEP
jgi:mannose-6-phosphate isomerase-like protein (cupin superfamily)